MASFSAGTTFTDGVANDVTAAKLGALVNNATPLSGLIQDRTAETITATNDTLLIGDASDSNNLKRITVANFAQTLPTAKITTGTIDTGTFGTTTSTEATITTGTITTGVITNLTAGTTTSTAATITTGTIPTLIATTLITSGTGTASAPAIVPTGDTDTGISFPAADTIAFSEGGTEALRLTSTGAISIGSSGTNYGSSNQVLTSQGNTSPIWVNAYTGFKNRIINGEFGIAQRATSFVSGANNDDSYNLDRWYVLSDGNDAVDITQTTSEVPSNQLTAIALDVETANKKFGIAQIIEQRNCIGLIGGNVTLSFKAKVSSTTKLDNIKAAVVAWSGTADIVTSDIISAWGNEGTNPTLIADATYENTPANLNVTTSYATYTVTANVDTASTRNLIVFIWSDVTDTTAGDFLYITDVQLEAGSTATDFERRPYGTELALCQRYYQKMSTNARAMTNGYNTTTTVGRYTKPFIVAMRAAPSALETTGTAANYRILHAATATTCSVVPAFSGASEYEIEITGTVASGLTAGQGSALAAAAVTDAYLAWGAEL